MNQFLQQHCGQQLQFTNGKAEKNEIQLMFVKCHQAFYLVLVQGSAANSCKCKKQMLPFAKAASQFLYLYIEIILDLEDYNKERFLNRDQNASASKYTCLGFYVF